MPQSLSTILIHIIFSTKNREPLLMPEIESILYSYMAGIFRDCGSPALAIGGTEDHTLVLCSLSRTRSVASIVEEIKTGSSKWIKTKGPGFNGFHWQRGYAAFSIGRSNEVILKRYIANQKLHHKKISFQDEMREFFQKYGVAYDEQFVWD